jgi:hypothetical protein
MFDSAGLESRAQIVKHESSTALELLVSLSRTPDREVALVLNLGRMDRGLRVLLGAGLAIAGIMVNGHPYVGRGLGVVGALVILSGGCGT